MTPTAEITRDGPLPIRASSKPKEAWPMSGERKQILRVSMPSMIWYGGEACVGMQNSDTLSPSPGVAEP